MHVGVKGLERENGVKGLGRRLEESVNVAIGKLLCFLWQKNGKKGFVAMGITDKEELGRRVLFCGV